MGRTSVSARVVENRPIAPGIYRMGIEAPWADGPVMPGQFCMLQAACPGSSDPLLKRPLSVHDAEDGVAWFLYRVVGKGTGLLARLVKGDMVAAVGPLGQPFPSLAGRRVVFVAGGMGVAPLPLLARRRSEMKVLLGARTEEELAVLDVLDLPGIEVEIATEDGSVGHKGLVTDLLPPLLEGGVEAVFTCGPMPMMREVSRMCGARGTACWASLEAAMACGSGLCMGCAVRKAGGGYLHVCSDGPVVDAAVIAWG